MWQNSKDRQELYDNRALEFNIKENRAKICFLDGPTGCGKTYFLRNMETGNVGVYPFSELLERFEKQLREKTPFVEFVTETQTKYTNDIVCLEDIDLGLAGRTETQKVFATLFETLSDKSKLILTGIEMDKRCKTLFKALRDYEYEYYRYTEGEHK